ncbi:MAG: HD domain-containing protein [Flavobacteriales bacterium]|nr:HD domain-containing protein [Flavobacteriales bacterium]MBP9079139.1 HD domain-containing protein [Flavobacteriales bacterium]
MDHQAAKRFILAELHAGLPSMRTYHCFEHTLDVTAAVLRIAQNEGITGEDVALLETAALFHDAGYMVQPQHHEQGSCMLALEHLPRFGYGPSHVERITGMIMGTMVPQRANDPLSEILCDADLDYLGRDDFFIIGDRLFQELRAEGRLHTRREWNVLQHTFLGGHTYFTATSRALRETAKQAHMAEVRQWLNEHP